MTPTEKVPSARHPISRRLWIVASLVLAAPLLGAAFWWAWRPEPIPAPPSVSLEGLDPAVARSIEVAEARVRESPRSSAAWGSLGMVLGAHAFRSQAVTCFAAAERFDPREPRWPYVRGVMLQLDGVEVEAVPALRRAVALCPADPDAVRLRLADLLVKEGDLEAAELLYRDLLVRDGGHAAAHLGLARIAVARGDPAEGGRLLSDSLDSPFVRRGAYLLLAEVALHLGDQTAAQEATRQAALLPPDAPWPDPFLTEVSDLKADSQTLTHRIESMRGGVQGDETHSLVEELESNHPALASQLEGRRQLAAGNLKAAEQAFREAARAEPDLAQAYFWLGVTLLDEHDLPGAASSFRQVVRLQPLHAAAYEKLGVCLEMQGDRAGAIEALKMAVRYLPQRAEMQRRLGELLAHDGQNAEALDHLRRALDLNPDDPAAKDLIKQVGKEAAPPPGP